MAILFAATSCERDNLEEMAPLNSSSTEELQGGPENGAVIPGKYIVVFKDGADFGITNSDNYERRQAKMRAASQAMLKGKGIAVDNIGRVYGSAIKGMAVGLSNAEVQRLRQDPRVAYIERDRVIKLAPPPGKGPNKDQGDGGDSGQGTQETPWGITRVGGAGNGLGKVAWVIDTGIDLDHPDLNVDASKGFTAFTSGRDANLEDNNGHGSHVAGTIAAINNSIGVVGVAAGATVIPVKVLDGRGSGSYSGVIAGVDHVAAKGASGDVANMSLGGPVYQTLDDAVKNAASRGIKFSLAAGNDGANANNSSPARANGNNIYTISAVNSSDTFASWSNYGNPPVDYAAPGVSIKSTWKDGGYNTISGTSMAAPHVAGILLLGSVRSSGTAKGDPDGTADPIASR
ncbi:MAG: S8 family peptidase [Hymenobacteraceae bacterium]|nr:S8 family peptidase [Hymenobacteraceae bacterium]